MGDARLLLKKNSDPSFFFDFFGYFCRKLRHADLDSREQQAILLKKRKISGQNFFFCFPAENLARFCHAVLDVREQ